MWRADSRRCSSVMGREGDGPALEGAAAGAGHHPRRPARSWPRDPILSSPGSRSELTRLKAVGDWAALEERLYG